MRIDDIGRAAGSEKSADVRGIDAVERNHIGRWLANEPGKSYMALGPPNGLGESAGRDGDASTCLTRPGEQHGARIFDAAPRTRPAAAA